MSPRRGVSFARFWRPVLAGAWAALSLGGATITPYQATRTPDFSVRADPLGEKTVWFHTNNYRLHQLIKDINADLKDCRLADFRRDVGFLRSHQMSLSGDYDRLAARVSDAKARLSAQTAIVADAERVLDGGNFPGYWEWRAQVYKVVEEKNRLDEMKQLVANGDHEAEVLLQDANTLASVVVWFERKQPHCRERPSAPPPPPPPYDPTDPNDPNCPAGVIEEINRARANPPAYADNWRGGDRETLDFLRQQPSIDIVDPNQPLSDAAESRAGDANAVGHTGSDGSTPMQRIQRSGLYSTMTAELIAIDSRTPSDAVHQLIIDRGNPTRAHRLDLFNPHFTLVGVACALDQPHPIIVIDLSNAPMSRDN